MATITSYKKKAKDCITPKDAHHSGRVPRLPFGHDAKKEAQKSDYRDKMTFDEIKENDLAMAEDAMKNSKPHSYPSLNQAMAFRAECYRAAIRHCCGADIGGGMSPELAQKMMDKAKVVPEARVKDRHGGPGGFYKGEDIWRNGVYIFKDGVLVAFISEPIIETPSQFAVDRSKKYTIHTNAKVHTKGFR